MGRIVLLLACFLSGCGGVSITARSGGRWPMMEERKLEYSVEEKAVLTEFGTQHPELARKIVNELKACHAEKRAYNIDAWKHNAEELRDLHYSENEIVRFLGANPADKKSDERSKAGD